MFKSLSNDSSNFYMFTDTHIPDLKNQVMQFLKQDAGFESLPVISVSYYNDNYTIQYSNVSSIVTAYGNSVENAFNDFTDKWHRFHTTIC